MTVDEHGTCTVCGAGFGEACADGRPEAECPHIDAARTVDVDEIERLRSVPRRSCWIERPRSSWSRDCARASRLVVDERLAGITEAAAHLRKLPGGAAAAAELEGYANGLRAEREAARARAAEAVLAYLGDAAGPLTPDEVAEIETELGLRGPAGEAT